MSPYSRVLSDKPNAITLSHWCIFHRKKAKQVVETWDRQFHSSPRDQRVPFLYLANDILQNSRRKGSEFVGEFWKVLPEALKDVFEKGDDYGRNAAMRLKFTVGGTLEKIVSAYQAVHDGHVDEDAVLSKCKVAVSYVEKMEKDVHNDCKLGALQESTLVEELREQDNILRQCIERLEASEMNRAALISHLREALQEQVAQSRSEQAGCMCQQLLSCNNIGQLLSQQSLVDANMFSDMSASLLQENQLAGDKEQVVVMQPMAPFAETGAQVDENHKKTAAAVAAKLAASTSSAQMLSFVLSSLASEAASMSSGLRASSCPVGTSTDYPLEKRQKMEQHSSNSEDGLPYMVHPPPPPPQSNSMRMQVAPLSQQVSPMQHQASPSNVQHQTSPSNLQHQSSPVQNQDCSPMSHQVSSMQHQPPPPPPPQYMQGVGGMMGTPYGYGGGLRRPPPLPGYPMIGLPPPGVPHYSIPPSPYQPFQPSDISFYNQPPLPTAPPISRQ